MLKFYPSWFVFFTMIVVGISFVVSSDNWFMSWMGFEFSLLGFLPMFIVSHSVVEGMIKYFLVQAGGSGLFLISFLISDTYYSGLMFLLSMIMKLGVFPFYQWVPMVMTSLSWMGCMLLSTVQKVAPLFMILNLNMFLGYFLLFLGCLSVLVGGVLGYNQSYMRSLMGYSSVSHSGWLVSLSVYGGSFLFIYFFVYCYVTVILFSFFHFYNVLKVVGGGYGYKSWLGMVLLMLTLSGVPPFSIFFLKLMAIYLLLNNWLILFFMLVGSMLSIYYYLTFVIPSLSLYWKSMDVNENGIIFLFFHSIIISFLFSFIFLF